MKIYESTQELIFDTENPSVIINKKHSTQHLTALHNTIEEGDYDFGNMYFYILPE